MGFARGMALQPILETGFLNEVSRTLTKILHRNPVSGRDGWDLSPPSPLTSCGWAL